MIEQSGTEPVRAPAIAAWSPGSSGNRTLEGTAQHRIRSRAATAQTAWCDRHIAGTDRRLPPAPIGTGTHTRIAGSDVRQGERAANHRVESNSMGLTTGPT